MAIWPAGSARSSHSDGVHLQQYLSRSASGKVDVGTDLALGGHYILVLISGPNFEVPLVQPLVSLYHVLVK